MSDTSFFEYGNVEPHAPLLKRPANTHELVKIMRVGDFLRSVREHYLHFQRVDSYKDFATADSHDGAQPARDRTVNMGIAFEKATTYSVADYYDTCRARTYACSFSLQNTPLIWERYGLGDPVGKIGAVFNFGKLRETLNSTIGNEPGRSALMVGSIRCKQVFYINHGLVEYVDIAEVQLNKDRLPNPIIYSYLKDRALFAGENEFRITLATMGMGGFALADGSEIVFPPSMRLDFDFHAAVGSGTIARILAENEQVKSHLDRELEALRIFTVSPSGNTAHG
jgi:hypothetical protein